MQRRSIIIIAIIIIAITTIITITTTTWRKHTDLTNKKACPEFFTKGRSSCWVLLCRARHGEDRPVGVSHDHLTKLIAAIPTAPAMAAFTAG
jgi:hypothetical protein